MRVLGSAVRDACVQNTRRQACALQSVSTCLNKSDDAYKNTAPTSGGVLVRRKIRSSAETQAGAASASWLSPAICVFARREVRDVPLVIEVQVVAKFYRLGVNGNVLARAALHPQNLIPATAAL
jgi:hypothetical protein